MLNIYTYKEKIPDDKTYVNDPEELLAYIKFTSSAFDKEVVKKIEKGTILDSYYYADVFGAKCSIDWLSTTSKILLGTEQTDFIINGVELGYNGYEFICELDRGYIYLPKIPSHIPNLKDGPEVIVDNVKYESFYDAWIGGC